MEKSFLCQIGPNWTKFLKIRKQISMHLFWKIVVRWSTFAIKLLFENEATKGYSLYFFVIFIYYQYSIVKKNTK